MLIQLTSQAHLIGRVLKYSETLSGYLTFVNVWPLKKMMIVSIYLTNLSHGNKRQTSLKNKFKVY